MKAVNGYIENRKIKELFYSAMTLSMMFLGGYPEMLYDMVIVLLPWIFFNCSGNDFLGRRVWNSLKIYVFIGILTIFAAAISLIPFINIMSKITRGEGQAVFSNTFLSVFTLLFPKSAEELLGAEISMQSFYVSFFVVIAIFVLLLKKDAYKQEKKYLFFY